MRRAALIYNPKAGRRGRGLAAVVAALRQSGFAAEPMATGFPGAATEIAREQAAGGESEVVFTLGGDGTVREAAAGLLGTDVPLGILPGGTVNLLGRTLGLPRDPTAAAHASGTLVPRDLDVGLAGGHPFLMMVSIGLDADLLSNLDLRLKRWLGQVGIGLQGLARWWGYGYPTLEIEVDGERLTGSFATVANIPFYGGPFRMAPDARPDDGRLDLMLFQGYGRRAALSFVHDLVRGTHTRRPDVIVRPVREVLFHGGEAMALQVDGDAARQSCPVAVRLAPEKLRVLVPGERT